MAKKNRKQGPPSQTAGGPVPFIVKRLSVLLEEKYGRRMPAEYRQLLDALSRPQELVSKDKNSPVTPKSDKNFKVERVLEELLDDLSAEELLALVPDTSTESKAYRAFIQQSKMARDEDTIWRRITGYPNADREWTGLLAARLQGKKCLEIMAGNGLLSRLLQDAGLSVIATDIAPDKSNDYISMRNGNYTDVLAMDAMAAVRRFGRQCDVLICSWPPQGEEAVIQAAQAFFRLRPEGAMVYIGEGKGGFNAMDAFFDQIETVDPLTEINQKHVSLPGSKDGIQLVRIKQASG